MSTFLFWTRLRFFWEKNMNPVILSSVMFFLKSSLIFIAYSKQPVSKKDNSEFNKSTVLRLEMDLRLHTTHSGVVEQIYSSYMPKFLR